MRAPSVLAIAVLVSSACVTDPDEPDELDELGERDDEVLSERAILGARIRALFPEHGIAPIPPPVIPGTPARRAALIALGQALAFDKILSDNQDVSCMTCHPPSLGTDDDRHLSSGVGGLQLGAPRFSGNVIPRNAPPMFNLHALDSLFWDGRVEKLPDGTLRTPAGAQLTPAMTAVFEFGALSALSLFPVTNRDEMRGHVLDGNHDDLTAIPDHDLTAIWEALMDRLRAIPRYRELFGDAYPDWPGSRTDRIDTMTFAHASNAIGAFIAAKFSSADSPWDRYVAGDERALDVIQEFTTRFPPVIKTVTVLRGAEAFLNACASCHSGPLLSDNRFHNTALVQLGPGLGDGAGDDDWGRARVTTGPDARCGSPGDGASCRYAFRTPPLRNVALTAPYGHAGQFGHQGNADAFATDLRADLADLRAFVAHYFANAATNLLDYDPAQLETSLRPTVVANQADIIAHLDPVYAGGFFNGGPTLVDEVTAFLLAQTSLTLLYRGMQVGSSSRLAPCGIIPASVPSGLPVDGRSPLDPC